MKNMEFKALNCACRLKAVVAGSLHHSEEYKKYSIRALIEGPDEDGAEGERVVFVGWSDKNPAPEIGCRLQLTQWSNLATGQVGLAYSPIVLDENWTMPEEEKTE